MELLLLEISRTQIGLYSPPRGGLRTTRGPYYQNEKVGVYRCKWGSIN